MQVKFRSDTKYRKEWLTGLHFSHPAKMHLSLQLWLVNRYTKPGDVILDPMAGSGTILVACSMGRDVIAVELEDKFVRMMEGNWQKIQQRGPQLGYQMGQATILQGDARKLEGVCDQIITSPPYAESEVAHDPNFNYQRNGKKDWGISMSYRVDNPSNIGNLPYGEIDKIITSPPYEGTISPHDVGPIRGTGKVGRREDRRQGYSVDAVVTSPPYTNRMDGGIRGAQAGMVPYTDESPDSWFTQRDQKNIGNLPYGDIADCVITSPPYGLGEGLGHSEATQGRIRKDKYASCLYGQCEGQIGNLKGGDIDAIIAKDKFTNIANKCYNIDKCLLEFILEPKRTKESELKPCEPKEQAGGQTLGNTSVKIVGIKLIDAQQSVNLVASENECLGSPYLNSIKQAFVNIIRECWANDIQFKQELKCLSPSLKVENLELLLTNAITTHLNGENGGNKSLNEINIPANFVKQNLKEGKLYILSHITFSQLLNTQNLSLKSLMDLPSAETATIKQKATKESQNSPNYLSEMLAVYKECWKCLKPSGLLILVLKNFIRDKKIIRLDLDTMKLCQQAGFVLEEQHYRKLTQQSFWRTIQLQKCDHRRGSKQNPKCTLGLSCPVQQAKQADMFGKTEDGQAMESLCLHYVNTSPKLIQEDILVFRKSGNGGIVDEVVMSPPYSEQSDFRLKGGLRNGSNVRNVCHKFGQVNNIGNLPYGEIDKVI